MEAILLAQLVREPTGRDALYTCCSQTGLTDVVIRSCLEQSNHKMIELSILGEVRRKVSKTAALGFWRTDLELFSTLIGRVPLESGQRGPGRMDTSQEGNFKGAGAGCPHVL